MGSGQDTLFAIKLWYCDYCKYVPQSHQKLLKGLEKNQSAFYCSKPKFFNLQSREWPVVPQGTGTRFSLSWISGLWFVNTSPNLRKAQPRCREGFIHITQSVGTLWSHRPEQHSDLPTGKREQLPTLSHSIRNMAVVITGSTVTDTQLSREWKYIPLINLTSFKVTLFPWTSMVNYS